MNQTLHIFVKDARRFWGEIVLSLAITLAFVFLGPYEWLGKYEAQSQSLMILAALIAVLVPVSWWVAITRVVHEERLVGDTQFWITRPYTWSNLLAAKVAFVLAFRYVPLFLAQLALLAEAGFTPLAYLPGLLYNLLLITVIIALPLAAIATVTSNFARMTLTLLGIFICFVAGIAALEFVSPGGHSVGVDGSLSGRISIVLAIVVFAEAIVLQYARRKVWASRRLLIALPLLLLAVNFFASKYQQGQINRIYATAQAATPIQLIYSPDPKNFETSGFQFSTRGQIPVKFRLAESGVGNEFAVLLEAVRVEMKAANGSHWESQWQTGDGYKFLSGETRFSPAVWMPMAEYRRFQGMPMSVHLTLAISQAQARGVANVPLPMHRFSVPDFGTCSPQTGWTPEPGQVTGITCVSALREPQLTYISTRWSDSPCGAAPDAGALGTAWVGVLNREPAQLGISPVVDPGVNLSNSQKADGPNNEPRYLCPGTSITFTQYERVARMQTSIDIQGFYLPKYSVTGDMITITQ
jgi:hypothetical protein